MKRKNKIKSKLGNPVEENCTGHGVIGTANTSLYSRTLLGPEVLYRLYS